MNKKQLVELGISDELADQIIVLHGKDIETHKGKISTAQTELEAAKGQLTEANAQIEKFKGMKTQEDVDTAVAEWKTKAEQAQSESAAQILKVKRDHALERDLKETYKVSDIIAVKAHLKLDDLKYNEKDDAFVGLKEQVEPIKTSYGSYFTDFVKPPELVTGSKQLSPTTTLADAIGQKLGLQGK